MMLEQRKRKGIIKDFEYQDVELGFKYEIPMLETDEGVFLGKDALLEIRKLK